MKIEIEKKITITTDKGEIIEVYDENLSAEAKTIGSAVDMINIGTEQMECRANKTLQEAVNEINQGI